MAPKSALCHPPSAVVLDIIVLLGTWIRFRMLDMANFAHSGSLMLQKALHGCQPGGKFAGDLFLLLPSLKQFPPLLLPSPDIPQDDIGRIAFIIYLALLRARKGFKELLICLILPRQPFRLFVFLGLEPYLPFILYL